MEALQEFSNATVDIWGAGEHPTFNGCPTVNEINDRIDKIGAIIDVSCGPDAVLAREIAADMGSLLCASKQTMACQANEIAGVIQSIFGHCSQLQSKFPNLTEYIRRHERRLSKSRMQVRLNEELVSQADQLELLGDTASHRALQRQLIRAIDSFDAYLSGLKWYHYAIGLIANRYSTDIGQSLVKSTTSANEALRKHALAAVDLSEFSLIVSGALNIADRNVKMSLVYGEEAFAPTNTALLTGAVNRSKLTILETRTEFSPKHSVPMAVNEGMLEFIDNMNSLAHQLKYVFSTVDTTLGKMDQLTDSHIGFWSLFTEKLT